MITYQSLLPAGVGVRQREQGVVQQCASRLRTTPLQVAHLLLQLPALHQHLPVTLPQLGVLRRADHCLVHAAANLLHLLVVVLQLLGKRAVAHLGRPQLCIELVLLVVEESEFPQQFSLSLAAALLQFLPQSFQFQLLVLLAVGLTIPGLRVEHTAFQLLHVFLQQFPLFLESRPLRPVPLQPLLQPLDLLLAALNILLQLPALLPLLRHVGLQPLALSRQQLHLLHPQLEFLPQRVHAFPLLNLLLHPAGIHPHRPRTPPQHWLVGLQVVEQLLLLPLRFGGLFGGLLRLRVVLPRLAERPRPAVEGAERVAADEAPRSFRLCGF